MLLFALVLATAPQAAPAPTGPETAAYRQILQAVAAEATARGDTETARFLARRAAALAPPAATPARPAPVFDSAEVRKSLWAFQRRLFLPAEWAGSMDFPAGDSQISTSHDTNTSHDSSTSTSTSEDSSTSSDASSSQSASTDASDSSSSKTSRDQGKKRAAHLRSLEKEVDHLQQMLDGKLVQLQELLAKQPRPVGRAKRR